MLNIKACQVDDCRLVDLPTHGDERGALTVVEAEADIRFVFRRVYWLHRTTCGVTRAGHAHRALVQCYVAAAGAVTVDLDDGVRRRSVRLDRPDQGLIIGPGLWRDLRDFTDDAVMLVLASEHYDEADYIRDHAAFLAEYGRDG
jgi:dTDP-4-dehydrorhamnose 3,5-epimerase-like enzyme